MHTYIHTHIVHTCMHTYMHACVRAYTHIYMYNDTSYHVKGNALHMAWYSFCYTINWFTGNELGIFALHDSPTV